MALVTVSGKGGAGKTTVAALLVQELVEAGVPAPILAVDGDPVSMLHRALGAPAPALTLADVRQQLRTKARSRQTDPDTDVAQVLAASGAVVAANAQVHLLAMGQAEGPGCYCDVNAALSTALTALLQQYTWVVVDNEAGIEHLSRLRVPHVDDFIVVTLPEIPAQEVTRRILATARQVKMTWRNAGLVVNRDDGQLALQVEDLPLWASIPDDDEVKRLSRIGAPVSQLDPTSPVRLTVRQLVREHLIGGGE